MPPEFLGPSRSGKATIDLSLLVQTQPDEYRVAAKDVLSIYIPGVLGALNVDENRQIGESPPINTPSNPEDPPTIGYPVTVRGNGTIALPYIPPIHVQGMTLPEIEVTIREAYTEKSDVLNGEQDRVLVSLQRRREYRVLVVRQETSSELTQGGQPGTLNIGNSKRGTAEIVRLPAYENDVLHALASSGQGADGLPGLDAKNTIYIIRRKKVPRTMMPGRNIRSDPSPQSPQPHGLDVSPTPVPSVDIHEPSQFVPAPEYPLQAYPLPRKPRSQAVESPVNEPQAWPPAVRGVPDSPPETTPAPAVSSPPLPEQNSHRRESTPGIRESAPVWPSPANPPSSIQRTSRANGATPAPAQWPALRGQSPESRGIWGHSQGVAVRIPRSSTTWAAPSADPHRAARHLDPESGAATTPIFATTAGHSSIMNHTVDESSHSRDWQSDVPAEPASSAWKNGPHMEASADIGGHDNSWQGSLAGFDPTIENSNVIKIPIRLAVGEYPTFTERDIILGDGDIVFIESRETEVFYTGGLLGGGQYTLPRDYDLRVLEAISIAQSQNNLLASVGRSIGGVSALNQDVTISASHVVILRSLPNGTRIPIEVDLYKAVRRPQENILIQPGDLIILQYTKLEAIAALFERHLLEGALFGVAATSLNNPVRGN